ncbi:MAG: nuclear transport factor 2 family protein [Chloroflexota bacterium]
MAHPNEELIGRWFMSQATQNADALREVLADDVVWHVPGKNLVSGDWRGPDEVVRFVNRVRELSGGTARPQLLGVLANDGWAVALVRMFAEREGRKLDGSFQAWAYRIADGKIAEFWFLVEDRYAVDAFWA